MSFITRPISVLILRSHAEIFWFGVDEPAKQCKIELHAVLVLRMHLGLLFDEVGKLKVEHISTDGVDAILTIRKTIKISTEERVYTLREWPENTQLRNCPYMDLVIAIFSCLTTRDCARGPLFCDVTETRGGELLNTDRELSSAKFCKILRNLLEASVIRKADFIM